MYFSKIQGDTLIYVSNIRDLLICIYTRYGFVKYTFIEYMDLGLYVYITYILKQFIYNISMYQGIYLKHR